MTARGHHTDVYADVETHLISASTSFSVDATRITVMDARPQCRARFFETSPVLRRIAFVIGYETLSLLFTIFVLGALLGHGGGESALTAVAVTLAATGWNYVWNLVYETIERRRGTSGRGAWTRVIHALGYEGGVLLFTVPLVAIILGVSLLDALVIEGGLLVFFLVFTLVYTWGFDLVCGLPASVR